MKLQSFIFIGRSGCGKGTQIKLLMDALKKKDPEHDILYIYTGQEFRKFIKGESATQKVSKVLYETGGLMPEFLTVHMWATPLIENYKGNQHLIFDGTPRKFHEAGVLNSIFNFYGLEKPWVVHLEISPEEAMKRLSLRQRLDDKEEDVTKRLAWYKTDVEPTIEYYKGNPNYNFLQIDGQRTPEAIHEDIVKIVGLV
ncbi:MAG: nucleoside monophosphate kinase [Candidatus Paceibacterota bacterium]